MKKSIGSGHSFFQKETSGYFDTDTIQQYNEIMLGSENTNKCQNRR